MKVIWPIASLVAAALCGGLLAATFPPIDAGHLVWVAVVPAFVACVRMRDWQAGVLGGVMGAVFAGLYLYWIRVIPGFPVQAHVLLLLYISAYYALFGYALRFIQVRIRAPLTLIAPPLWVSLEFARVNAGFLALPGGLLGHTQYENIALIQIASLTSAYGVSFLIVLVNAALADAILWFSGRRSSVTNFGGKANAANLAAVMLVFSLIFLWGGAQLKVHNGDSNPPLKIAVVQANIPQAKKWDRRNRREIFQRYYQLTVAAAKDSPDLIVWPEAAVPGYLRVGATTDHMASVLARETGVPLVLGSTTSAKFADEEALKAELRNSAFLLDAEGKVLGQYDKLRLLPFSEYVPLEGQFPWPAWLIKKGDSLVAGKNVDLFELYGKPFGVVICWEALFPTPFREFVRRGARLMLNLSNEARFDGSEASRQFLAMTVFRAIEHRIWLVRSANTGISAAIDPLGVIRSRVMDESGLDISVGGVMTVSVPVFTAGTFYTSYGDVFAWACVIIALAILIYALIPGWRRREIRLRPLHRLTSRVDHADPRPVRSDRRVFRSQMTD